MQVMTVNQIDKMGKCLALLYEPTPIMTDIPVYYYNDYDHRLQGRGKYHIEHCYCENTLEN